MRRVFKFRLADPGKSVKIVLHGRTEIHDANIVLLAEQRGHPHLWAEVDPTMDASEREFHTVGTGEPMDADFLHVGSFMSPGGVFVWHVYEKLSVRRFMPRSAETAPPAAGSAERIVEDARNNGCL